LTPVVENQPLAMCDRETVQDSDWEIVEKIQTNWIEESMYLKYNKQHKWYWLSNQTIDEVTCLVVWDSERADNKTGAFIALQTLKNYQDSDGILSECSPLFFPRPTIRAICLA
jgi:hypothetical protein